MRDDNMPENISFYTGQLFSVILNLAVFLVLKYCILSKTCAISVVFHDWFVIKKLSELACNWIAVVSKVEGGCFCHHEGGAVTHLPRH